MVKEKYKEENKMLKSINEELSKKNKKQYDTLKNEKEKLEEKKKERAKENLEEKKIRVNQIKKLEDKDKNDKESTNEKNSAKTMKNKSETMNSILFAQEQMNREKELIEQYKIFCEDLIKQEKEYLEKIEEAKKASKNRSGSAGRIRVFIPKNKNKNMKDRTKSSYKMGATNNSDIFMTKYHNKLKEIKKLEPKGSHNIKKVNANEI